MRLAAVGGRVLDGNHGGLGAGVTPEGGQDGPDGGISGANTEADSRDAGEEDGGRDQHGVHVVRPSRMPEPKLWMPPRTQP